MTEELKVSLGVRTDGSVVHIAELDESTDRGLNCSCTCADCGDRLIARLGRVRQHHFAHHTVQDCTKSDETALHLFAKEVFQRHDTFMVPDAEVCWGYRSKVVLESQYIPYGEAVLEQSLEDITPDVTLVRPNGKKPLLIEILVTHAVDEDKQAKLKRLNLPCIQIDLSDIHVGLEEFDRDGIEQLLIHSDDLEKEWVCIPDEEKYIGELQEEARLAAERRREEESEQERRKREKQEWLKRSAESRHRRQSKLISPEYVAAADARKETELTQHPSWRWCSRTLNFTADNIPYYLNHPVDGEYLFKCHRTIWQSALFIPWVFNKADMTRSRDIPIEYVLSNMKEKSSELLELELYWAFRDRDDVLSTGDAVGQYFVFLAKCGFVRKSIFGGRTANPFSWNFECLRPRVVALPPEFNSPRYRPREDGILDTETGELITF